MEQGRKIQIESTVQLLVEGNDPRNFFEAFIRFLSLEDVQVQNFGGVHELSGFLLALVDAPGFPSIRRVGVVRDAETSAKGAFQSVRSALEKTKKLPVPSSPEEFAGSSPAVAVLILPGNNSEGMLETLLCESIVGTSEARCIDEFFECVETEVGVSIQRPDKARAHAYIAIKPDPHLSVGVAARKGYWDFEHGVFGHVGTFLKRLSASAKDD